MTFQNAKKKKPPQSPAEKLSGSKGPKIPRGRFFTAHECRCREVRHELGLTIRDVAAATGISNPCICDVERGSETTLGTARKLAKFYGKSVDWLWPEIYMATAAWGMKHFGGIITNKQLPLAVMREAVKLGLCRSNGMGYVCDADGFIKQPERERLYYELLRRNYGTASLPDRA